MHRLLARLRAQRAELRSSLDAIHSTVLARAETTGDDSLTDAEARNAEDLETQLRALDDRIAGLVDAAEREAAAASVLARADQATGPATPGDMPVMRAAGGARVVDEPMTYRSADRGGEHSFFRDALLSQTALDGEASARLQRHRRELEVELRDTTTASYSGMIPPLYLLDLAAPLLRAGRPTANRVRRLPLPPMGMSVIVPRTTTGGSATIQATQNTAFAEVDQVVTDLTVQINTIAGQQDVSRQAIERGGPGLDVMVFQDLAQDYARTLNQQVLFGSGASGQAQGIVTTAGIIAVTYTDASPTVGELYSQIANAVQQVNSQRFLPPDLIIMHPRRWGWFQAAVDTTGRPLVVPSAEAPMNAIGVGNAAAVQQVVGTIMGLPVVTDPSVRTNQGGGTNQDEIIVTRADDLLLWEQGDGSPREFRFEQTLAGATIRLAVYGNFAFSAARYPVATALISGTGLTPPTF